MKLERSYRDEIDLVPGIITFTKLEWLLYDPSFPILISELAHETSKEIPKR
jgi:hypothetical protein